MFIIKDCTKNPSHTVVSNDVKDVRDIIIGITGDEAIGDYVLHHVGHMSFGDVLIGNPYYIIDCVPDI